MWKALLCCLNENAECETVNTGNGKTPFSHNNKLWNFGNSRRAGVIKT